MSHALTCPTNHDGVSGRRYPPLPPPEEKFLAASLATDSDKRSGVGVEAIFSDSDSDSDSWLVTTTPGDSDSDSDSDSATLVISHILLKFGPKMPPKMAFRL